MGTTWALPVKYHLWTKFGTCSIDFQGPMDHRPTTGPLPQPMLSDHEKSFAGDPPQVQVEWRHLDSRKEMIGMTRQDCINLYLVFVVFLAHTNHKSFHSCKWVWECKSRFKGRTKLDTVSSRKEWRRFHRMQKIGPASRFPWVPMSSHEFPWFTDDLSWCPRTLRSPVEPTRKCLLLQQHVHNTKISLLGKLTWLHMASHGLTWLDHPGPFQEISKSKDDVAEAFWKVPTTCFYNFWSYTPIFLACDTNAVVAFQTCAVAAHPYIVPYSSVELQLLVTCLPRPLRQLSQRRSCDATWIGKKRSCQLRSDATPWGWQGMISHWPV